MGATAGCGAGPCGARMIALATWTMSMARIVGGYPRRFIGGNRMFPLGGQQNRRDEDGKSVLVESLVECCVGVVAEPV